MILKKEYFNLIIEVCRHRKKHDADRYCAYNLLILLGPVAGRETFYEYIKFDSGINAYILNTSGSFI